MKKSKPNHKYRRLKGGCDIDNLLLIVGGLAAASCFLGAALYLMSMFNQTQYSNSKNNAAVEDLVERIATTDREQAGN